MDFVLDFLKTTKESGWSPVGQGLFLLIVIVGVLAALTEVAKYGVTLVRGWPKNAEKNDTDA